MSDVSPIPVLLLLADPTQAEALQAELARLAPEIRTLADGRLLTDCALAEIEYALGWRMPAGLHKRLPALRWAARAAAAQCRGSSARVLIAKAGRGRSPKSPEAIGPRAVQARASPRNLVLRFTNLRT